MKFGVPWSVKGIRPEARETAKEAARRSGMSLGEWLNAVIIQQAEQEGVQAPALADDEDRRRRHRHMHQRLDELAQRIEQLARTRTRSLRAASAAATSPIRAPSTSPVSTAFSINSPARGPPPQTPNVKLSAGLDRAVAEIAARKRTLNSEPGPHRNSRKSRGKSRGRALPRPDSVRVPLPRRTCRAWKICFATSPAGSRPAQPGLERRSTRARGTGEIARALGNAMPRKAIDSIERRSKVSTHHRGRPQACGDAAGRRHRRGSPKCATRCTG